MPKLVSKFKYKNMTLVAIVVASVCCMALAFAPNVWMFTYAEH